MGCGNWKGTQSPGEMKQECTRKWGWGPCSPADRHSSMCTCECAQGSGGSGGWQRSGFGTVQHRGHAEGGDVEVIWTCRALPLRSTGWPGLLTDGSVKTEEGALAGPDSASPTGTSKSWEKGLELGG